MSPESVAALTAITKMIENLGPGGFITIMFAGPVITTIVVMLLAIANSNRQQRLLEIYREDSGKLLEQYRTHTTDLVERNRERTDMILEKYEAAQTRIANFYTEQSALVKSVHQLAEGFQDIVITNTRSMERLAADIEHVLGMNRRKD